MSYTGEIRLFAGSFAPAAWAFCSGQSLQIAQYPDLFALIGTTYGGDGAQTFNLPDLRARVPMHMGVSPDGTPRQLGERFGSREVVLTQETMPPHSHALAASATPAGQQPPGGVLATAESVQPGMLMYGTTNVVAMSSAAMAPTTGDLAHENRQPCLGLNFIISLTGSSATGDPFLGEVRAFATLTPPKGWVQCNGQKLPTADPYLQLWSICGMVYGGDDNSFALPDLQGRVPLHVGGVFNDEYALGETAGLRQVTLEAVEMPSHNHVLQASDARATSSTPQGRLMARGLWNSGTAAGAVGAYSSLPPNTPMAIEAVGVTGSSQPHENMQPYLTVNYCIATVGDYPSPGAAENS